MNKRGQMYILAAVLLCIAIYGVMKITNVLVIPAETDFDFYIENFRGERAYVVDLGFIDDSERTGSLLDVFTKFGTNTGIVYIEYEDGIGWTVTNYLGEDITTIECVEEECNEVSIPSGDLTVGILSFEIGQGRKYYISESTLSELERGETWFIKSFTTNDINIKISENVYEFKEPAEDKIESIIFQNIDKNYVKVVRI